MINGKKIMVDDGLPFGPKKSLKHNQVWYEETDEILRELWGKLEPPEIATEVNSWLRIWADIGKKQATTSDLGGGVITRARVLNMISEGDFERLYVKYVIPHFE